MQLTNEDVEFISKNILVPWTDELMKVLTETETAKQDTEIKMWKNIFEKLIVRIKQIEYVQARDRMFFKGSLKKVLKLSDSDYDNFYKDYCDEFDKLNKSNFFDSEDGEAHG